MHARGTHARTHAHAASSTPPSSSPVRYLAPEALKSRDYLTTGSTDKLDMFALGASM